jgi:prepilin-type N-terminal cleavage/methylation domain-containing protein
MQKILLKKGMTLAEIIVAIGILGLIMVAVSNFQKDVLLNNRYGQDSLTGIQDSRVILRTIVRELRGASQSNNGAFPILSVATNTMAFFSDTNSDGLKEQIRYFLSGSKLQKGIIKPTGNPLVYSSSSEVITTLADNIRNSSSTPLFRYYNSSYSGTEASLSYPITLSNIHLVRIDLSIDVNPSRSPLPRTYSTQVSLRNLKDNL